MCINDVLFSITGKLSLRLWCLPGGLVSSPRLVQPLLTRFVSQANPLSTTVRSKVISLHPRFAPSCSRGHLLCCPGLLCIYLSTKGDILIYYFVIICCFFKYNRLWATIFINFYTVEVIIFKHGSSEYCHVKVCGAPC